MKKLIRTVQTGFSAFQPSWSSREMSLSKLFGRDSWLACGDPALLPDGPDALYVTIGYHQEPFMDSIMARKRKSRIVSFEPNPYLHQRLASRYAQAANVTIHSYGLGERESAGVLHVPFYRHHRFDGLASPDKNQAAGLLREELYWYNEKFLSLKEIGFQVVPLDDLDLQPAFIRLTTKGCKLSILTGAKRTLRAHAPTLLIEEATEEVTVFLKKFGYRNYRYVHSALNPGYGNPNTFYVIGDTFQQFRHLIQQSANQAKKGLE